MPTRSTRFDDSGLASAALRGLASSNVWDDGALTYHLEYSDFDGNGVDDWAQDGARAAIQASFAVWANVADLTFTETSRSNANMVERISSADGNLGFHFLPGGNGDIGRSDGELSDVRLRPGEQSDGEFNQDGIGWDSQGLLQGGYGFITLIHEIGHGLGLEHPFDSDLLSGVAGPYTPGWFDLNQGVYTTMAYADGWDLRGGSPSDDFGWQGTPMALDIAAIQAIYGANESFAAGDDSYALPTANGSGTFFSSIWDTGGRDQITYGGARDAVVFLDEATIDDTATGGGLISYVEGVSGGFTIARGAVIEDAATGSGDDLIAGNAGANTLRAGAGADTVFGLDGADVIMGGAGDDLLIGDYAPVSAFGGTSPSAVTGPDLPDAWTPGDGAVRVSRTSRNDSEGQAVDLRGEFALTSDPGVLGGVSAYNAEVTAEGSGGFDYYRIVLDEKALVVADIDGAWSVGGGAPTSRDFDSVLSLQSGLDEILLADDSSAFIGGTGSGVDYGVDASLDSYFSVVLDPGTYYIVVKEWIDLDPDPNRVESGTTGVTTGATYTLNVSVDTSVPASLPEDALGQVGYYYEQPSYAVADAAFGASVASGSVAKAPHEGEDGDEHGGHGGHASGGHGRGGGLAGSSDADDADDAERGDPGETALFAFEAELDAIFAQDDALIA